MTTTTISQALDQDIERGDIERVLRVGMVHVWPHHERVLCVDALGADGTVWRYLNEDYCQRFGVVAIDLTNEPSYNAGEWN